jgi:hypothetical protein
MPDNVCLFRDDGQENAISIRGAAAGVRCPHRRWKRDSMFWFVVVIVLLVVAAVVRRLMRGRHAPEFDQKNLEKANYARINQDVANFDRRFGDHI